jgi:enoyl-CoA hydratase/carnithine racemase
MSVTEGKVVVTLERRGSTAWITLARPEAMNALNPALVAQLSAAVHEADEDANVRVVVVTGSGKAFSAGADLKAISSADGSVDVDRMLGFVAEAADMIESLANLGKPTIAAVNGLALAGGLELALACDLIIASETALLGDAHANFGLLPGAGGSVRLTRRIGAAGAKRLMFSGDMIPATELVPCGLVDEAVPAERLESTVDDLATRFATKSPAGLAAMKHLVNYATDASLVDALEAEQKALATHAQSPDLAEGLAAFRAKRPPAFGSAPSSSHSTLESP